MYTRSQVINAISQTIHSSEFMELILSNLSISSKEKVEDDDIAPIKKRFLPPNTSSDEKHSNKSRPLPKRMSSREDSGIPTKSDVVIVLNYGARSHAMFGSFHKVPLLTKFKEKFLKRTAWTRYSGGLKFGPGWVVMKKENLFELEDALLEYGIEYRLVEKDEYEKELENPPPVQNQPKASSTKRSCEYTTQVSDGSRKEPESFHKVLCGGNISNDVAEISESTDDSEDEGKEVSESDGGESSPSDEESPEEEVFPKRPAEGEKLRAPKNRWGNNEERNTQVVFAMLPVGKNKKKVPVAIGKQEHTCPPNFVGMRSIVALSTAEIRECEDVLKWRVISDDIISKLRKYNETDLADMYEEFMDERYTYHR